MSTPFLSSSHRLTRRQFLHSATLVGSAAAFAGPALLRGKSLNEKLNIGIIGAGGRGASNTQDVIGENIVALCDVDENNLNNDDAPSTGMSVDDVLYILFRHKWLIFAFICLGVAGACMVRVLRPPMYVSQAQLNVPYVKESGPTSIGPDTIKPTESGAQSVINTEVIILQSLDVASNVGVSSLRAAEEINRLHSESGGIDGTGNALCESLPPAPVLWCSTQPFTAELPLLPLQILPDSVGNVFAS